MRTTEADGVLNMAHGTFLVSIDTGFSVFVQKRSAAEVMEFIRSVNVPDVHLRVAAIACGTYGSFFLLYSGYRKPAPQSTGLDTFNGSLDPVEELPKIFAPEKLGGLHSNRQLNKVAALAGLTLSGMAALPEKLVWEGMQNERLAVLRIGVASLGAHILYSIASFYKWNPINMLKGAGKNLRFEQLALVAGNLAFGGYIRNARGDLEGDALSVASLLGMTHFYLMETKSGLPEDLPVRPWGYVAFLVPGIAVGLWARRAASSQ